jgi:hypothetical protein
MVTMTNSDDGLRAAPQYELTNIKRGKFPVTLEREFSPTDYLRAATVVANATGQASDLNADHIAREMWRALTGLRPNSARWRAFRRNEVRAKATYRFGTIADATLFKLRWG